MVLSVCFSRRATSFIPLLPSFLAYLFSFLCKQSHIFLFYQHFSSISRYISIPLFVYPSSLISANVSISSCAVATAISTSYVFISFRPSCYTIISSTLLLVVFALFSTHILSLFAFLTASSIVLHPLFCHFLDRPSSFSLSTYVTFPRPSFFTFHVSQNVSRETSFFTIFGLRRSVRSDLLPGFPKITLIFHLSYF